jgi:hypothetical protein
LLQSIVNLRLIFFSLLPLLTLVVMVNNNKLFYQINK